MESYCVFAGSNVEPIPNAKYLLNENIVYDPQDDCQRISRSGFSETKLLPHGASLSIFSNSGKYYPELNDLVIGIIKKRGGFFYDVDIRAPTIAKLGVLEFEGATKRSKPKLEAGQVIYARVLKVSRYGGIELSCISPFHKKAWTTGEAFFGPLIGGYTLECSQLLSRSLLEKDNYVLKRLGKDLAFEVASGMNGRVWIKSGDVKDTVLITNMIEQSEKMSAEQLDKLITTILKSRYAFVIIYM